MMGNSASSTIDSQELNHTQAERGPDREDQVATENKLSEESEVSSSSSEPEDNAMLDPISFARPGTQQAYGKVEYQDSPDTNGGVSFRVFLNCTGEKTTTNVKTLVIKDGMPLRVRDLKSCIEQEYSIPSCSQALVLESVPMEDSLLLDFYHVRDGDTIHINYTSEGDVAEILDVVNHMLISYNHIKSVQDDLNTHLVSNDMDAILNQCMYWEKVNELAEVYFTPCSSDRAEANRNLFVQCGGLDMLQRLHMLLLKQPWSNTPLKMQYLEHSILRTYWNITASFGVRMHVLRYPKALDSILQSFLRVELEENKVMKVPKNLYAIHLATTSELNRIACEVVYKAMGALCNLAEIPECRMQIAGDERILKQLVVTLMTPSYNSIASLVAMAGMLCLAYSAETHQFLATKTIVDGVMNACKIHRPDRITEDQRRIKLLLLKYFANVLFAQLLATSSHLFSLQMKESMVDFMEEFLLAADHREIREEEVRNGYKWSTLVPFMKLAYHPYSQRKESLSADGCEGDEDLLRLARCCIRCGIFSLSNVLLCQETREIFMEEGLLDYVVSMPWIFPAHWKEREDAHSLVNFLSQHTQLQPPSLINLTKARLASMHFGLERVLKTGSVHEMLLEVYSS